MVKLKLNIRESVTSYRLVTIVFGRPVIINYYRRARAPKKCVLHAEVVFGHYKPRTPIVLYLQHLEKSNINNLCSKHFDLVSGRNRKDRS